LDRLNLEEDYQRFFLKADPLWYGLWARSPLVPRALQILRAIFSEVRIEDQSALRAGPSTDAHLKRLEDLIRATVRAEECNLKLEVSLGPPGHTDFGLYTVFPHCPVCKADAGLSRWQHIYPTEPHTCEVCGNTFSPAATASSQPMNFHDGDDLRELLGQTEFEDFAKKYLMSHGADENNAIEMVALAEEENRQRMEKVTEQHRKRQLQRSYIEEILYQGIEQSLVDDAVEWPAVRFRADAFAEVLRRCKNSGVQILSMTHEAPEYGESKFEIRIADPNGVFQKWRAEGCDGLFSATFRVPEELIGA